ncbi:MAG: hypothetical protein AB7U34_05980 [Novosphingobium sp.]
MLRLKPLGESRVGKTFFRLSDQIIRRKRARPAAPADWRKRISDHVAAALLVYAFLQIIVTAAVMQSHQAAFLPYVVLVLLVAGVIPAFRKVERWWERLDDGVSADSAWEHRFRRDRRTLWITALGLPVFVGASCEAGLAIMRWV